MKESIKTGGVGKNPAIEKINQLNELSSRMQAAALLEKKTFCERQERTMAEFLKRQRIIEDFHISFINE